MAQQQLSELAQSLEGDLHTDLLTRKIYATDASVYRELPEAVCLPKTTKDLQYLIHYAKQNKTSLIPRTAGTSLAGQVVGKGIVVDFSKYFNQILEFNKEEQWIWVQPGVVRDELNLFLKPYGLFFAPETSTSNRAMIGGMVGNNSCGSNSIRYGDTRAHTLAIKALLSDGSEVLFSHQVSDHESNSWNEHIQDNLYQLLSDPYHQELIKKHFPQKSVTRRNTGYALDQLIEYEFFGGNKKGLNWTDLLCGSEGTLTLSTAIKLKLSPFPPNKNQLLGIHFGDLYEALQAALVIAKYQPYSCELIDHYILECTEKHPEFKSYATFVQGRPKAILIVDLKAEQEAVVVRHKQEMIRELQSLKLGYAYPVLESEEADKVWKLRKAGLGLLSNLKGDAKPVAVVEDTAVSLQDLPDYIAAFNAILQKYNLNSVHYAHAGAGELHLRPILNLKIKKDRQLFRKVAEEVSDLVKKYKGSISGEHGDGRLRAEFIPRLFGEEVYELFKKVKTIFDPDHIFNPGKIADAPPMDQFLRYEEDQKTPTFTTLFNFKNTNGILRMAEMCNGSGDCRKSHLIGGTMCPSYMATKDEKDTTRARANALREFLSTPNQEKPFDHTRLKEVMDLCISCKGCKSECPSNVDMSKLKAEFLYQYYKNHSRPKRMFFISKINLLNKWASKIPYAYNFLINSKLSNIFKSSIGISSQKKLPQLSTITLYKWFQKNYKSKHQRKVYLLCDEFTQYYEVQIGIKAIQLLDSLGYQVVLTDPIDTGRVLYSLGYLSQAKKKAEKNVRLLKDLVNDQHPLIGLEPSALLSFRDEYPEIVNETLEKETLKLAGNCLLLEEFLAREMDMGNVRKNQFYALGKSLHLHGHCHQKAIVGMAVTMKVLSLLSEKINQIPSGCCGMAGSFGYEKEHELLSSQIGNLVLFPYLRKIDKKNSIVVASGTSCRHQIAEGVQLEAKHWVEVLWEQLIK